MNIIDRIYYFMYCLASFGQTPSAFHIRARGCFTITSFAVMLSILNIGTVFISYDKQFKLIPAVMIAILSWFFSEMYFTYKGRGQKVIERYEKDFREKRNIGAFFGLLIFASGIAGFIIEIKVIQIIK